MNSLDGFKDMLNHVFNTNEDSKKDMMNIVQYSMMSIIPIVFLNKTMARYVPEADEGKGSAEITAEVIIQIVTMFIGQLFIHRLNTFFPTYSGEKYPEFHVIEIILSVLMITLSLQTKLGEKVDILVERGITMWNGVSGREGMAPLEQTSEVKVSQPFSTSQSHGNPGQQVGVTSIRTLPTTIDRPVQQQQQQQPSQPSQQMQQMQQTQQTQQTQENMLFEPMAANEEGNMFGAW